MAYRLTAVRRFKWQGRLVKVGSTLVVDGDDALRCCLHWARMGWARPADAPTRLDVEAGLLVQRVLPPG